MAVALGCLFLGSRALQLLTTLLAGIMCFEWARLTVGGPNRGWGIGLFTGVFLVPSTFITAYRSDWRAFGAALLISLAFIVAATFLPRFKGRRIELLLGILYIVAAGVSLIALRNIEPQGVVIILWLFAIAWAGDTAAYVIGRAFGRHALRPFANKTWEGFFGGAAAGAIVGAILAPPLGWALGERIAASAALAVAAQLGDLLESAAKRRFGVKDMSGLVPGHGGVLDRLDSLLLVLIVAGAAFVLSRRVML